MKFKLQAGAELEMLTKAELREELAEAMTAWRQEIARGVRFRKFSASGVRTGGTWAIGGDVGNNDTAQLGPQSGFVWALTRLIVSGGGIVAGTDAWQAYLDVTTPSRLLASTTNSNGVSFDPGAVVLVSGETLAFTGVGTGAGTDVTVAGHAVELPIGLAWHLL